MTEVRTCQWCGSGYRARNSKAKFCSGACKQADYRAQNPRKAWRPKQKDKRPDTRYLILPARVLDEVVAEVDAHSREDAIRAAGGGELIAVPARNVGG